MKYSDLPNIPRVPYIQVNGCDNENEENWPLFDDGYSPPGLTRQGSQSCGELNWIVGMQNNMPEREPSPYITMTRGPGEMSPASTSRSRGISRDGDYVCLRPAQRKTKCTSLDKDPEDDDYLEDGPTQGITDVALRKYAIDRRSGVPSRVYEVLYDFNGTGVDELQLTAGDTVTCIMDKTGENGWFYGETQDGKKGLFPETFVKLLGDGPRQIRQSQVTFGFQDIEQCLLGRGGCADVYRVFYNNRLAALKVFRKTQARSEPRADVRREAIMINRLVHPNIIGIYGMCLDVPHVGLVLELCEGRALKNMLTHVEKTDTFVSVLFMVDWAVQIATAMEFLTDKGILHRDLKAENVLIKERVCYCERNEESAFTEFCQNEACLGSTVRSKLTLKITDFGTTKERLSEDDKRSSSHIVGTYSWMAPEAFRDHQYTEASDVWSFGVVLWEILTKKMPYEGLVPIIAAFNASKQGSTLEVGEACPLQWKSIMNSCWEIEPSLRPTFKQIKADLVEYERLLEAEGVSVEEEERVEKAQREIMDIITNFRDNPHATDEYTTYYEKLYRKITSVNDLMGSKNNAKETKVPPKRIRNHKIKKSDIGTPSETRHVASIRPTSTSPHGSNNLTIILSEGRSPDATNTTGPELSGTLPRIPRKPARENELHQSLTNTLSVSSPNLNNITDGNSTLKRKDAIKRPKNKSIIHNNSVTDPLPDNFANISLADPAKFVDALATPVRRPSSDKSPAKISSGTRRSEDATVKEHKSRFRAFLPRILGGHRNSRSTEENGDESPQPTLPHSARSSTSSSKALAPFAHLIKGPTPLGSLDRPSSAGRQRVSSNTFMPDEESVGSLGRKNKISPSDEHRPHANSYGIQKPTSFSQAENLNPRHRITGLDETIPSPSEISGAMEYQQHRTHQRNPSDDLRSILPRHEFPRQTPTMSPPSHSAPKLLNDLVDLSTVIPQIDDDSFNDNPYVLCGPLPTFTSGNTAVNNAPYVQMPHKTPVFQAVNNDQYFHCSSRPERPDTLPLKHAVTPESSGISTGGSSAFSSHSLLNDQVPTMHAPPPPMLPPRPAIPPRDGSVGLPVQSAS